MHLTVNQEKKFRLLSSPLIYTKMDEIRKCKHHGDSLFRYYESQGKWRCLKCQTDSTQKRRNNLKIKAIEYKGGKCEICGYDKCVDALDFHHLDPSEKEFRISDGYTRSWEKVQIELDKCMLVCANCHREIHAELHKKEKETEMGEN